jgi:hypothetical protein
VWLTDEGVTATLRERLVGVEATSIHPSIAAKKIASVRKVHAAHLPPDETVLGVYDGTVFGSASDGFLVTARRFCWKNQLEQPQFLEWTHFPMDEVYAEGNRLVVGRAKIDTLFPKDHENLWAWAEVLQSLARAARQGQAGAPEPVGGPEAVAKGWGGPEVLVASAATAGWGGTASTVVGAGSVPIDAPLPEEERFDRAPYTTDRSCAVVDAHPTGELVLASGPGIIELRYAANGQRYKGLVAPASVLSAHFSPDGTWLLAGCTDRRASLFEVRTGTHRGATPVMEDYCDEVCWLGSTSRFAMASQRGEVWVVDASTMSVVGRVLEPDPSYANLGGIAATPDGARLFVSVGRRVGAFDTYSGAILWRVDEALYDGARLAVSPRGDLLVAAGHDGVAFFDARTGKAGPRYQFRCARSVAWPEVYEEGGLLKRRQVELGYHSWSPRPRFSPRGDLVAVQDHVGNLCFIDAATTALHSTPRQIGCAWIEDIAWFRSGEHVLLGMSDNTIAIWSVRPLAGVMRGEAIGVLPEEAYANAAYLERDDDDFDDDD